MNGREKRIHKEHTNERKQSQLREENRRASERIQELIQQTRSNLGLSEVNKHEQTKS